MMQIFDGMKIIKRVNSSITGESNIITSIGPYVFAMLLYIICIVISYL